MKSRTPKILHEVAVARVPFTQVYRQKDPVFVERLRALRCGEGIADAVAAINAACVRPHRAGRWRPRRAPPPAPSSASTRSTTTATASSTKGAVRTPGFSSSRSRGAPARPT